MVIGGGVTGLSTARALVELGAERRGGARAGHHRVGRERQVERHRPLPLRRPLPGRHGLALPAGAGARRRDPRGGRRLPPDRATWSGWAGEPRRAPGQRGHAPQHSGSRSSWSAATTAQELWPGGRASTTSPPFAYEPRGGYGDGHQTALAFAAAARRGGARIRQTVRGGRHRACAVNGSAASAWRTASASRPTRSCWPPAPGRWRWPPSSASTCPSRPSGPRSSWSTPGDPLGPTSRSSPTWCRSSTSGPRARRRCWSATATTPTPEWADPDDYRERADDGARPDDPQVRAPLPRPGRGPAWPSSYAGCYDVTPDYNPMISASPVEGLWLCAGFSRARLQDLPVGRRADGRPHHHGAQPPSRRRPPRLPVGAVRRRTTIWSAPIPTPAPGRCAETLVVPVVGVRRHILISRGHSVSPSARRRYGTLKAAGRPGAAPGIQQGERRHRAKAAGTKAPEPKRTSWPLDRSLDSRDGRAASSVR